MTGAGAPAVAWFVSPHGFGHAARAAAAIEALREAGAAAETHLFTRVPRWFFEDSLRGPFRHHDLETDVGFVQRDALRVDLPATAAALERLYGAGLEDTVAEAAGRLRSLGCRLAVCDISPLGLLAARRAGIPSVLVENFTWDWLYRAYASHEPRLAPYADLLGEAFAAADLRLQAEPVCRRVEGALAVPPIARRPRARPDAVRFGLGLEPGRPAVVLSMGGLRWRFSALHRLDARPDLDFVVFAGVERTVRRGNQVLLPDRSPVYHPDLVAAADAVVGKLGYSTVAEVWASGQRLAYLPRPGWPEHPALEAFVRESLPCRALGPEGLFEDDALDTLDALLAEPRPAARREDGAAAVASALTRLL